MRALLVFLVLAVAPACADDKKQPTAPPASAPADQPPTAVEPEPAAPTPTPTPAPTVPDAGEEDPFDACKAECIKRNQMRAVSAEQIETDCYAECSERGHSDGTE